MTQHSSPQGSDSSEKSVVVISGGMGYVGQAIARAFAREGASVIIFYHTSSREVADSLLASLPGEGHAAYECDVTDEVKTEKTVQLVAQTHGPVNAYIFAAGSRPTRTPLHLASSADVLEALQQHALGGFHFLKAGALQLKKKRGGTLIGITSSAVVDPEGTHALGTYLPAKYALQGMLAGLREELRPFGVWVYSVAPSFMESGMNASFPKAFVELLKAKSPTRTLTTAEDVAKQVLALASAPSQTDIPLTTIIEPELPS